MSVENVYTYKIKVYMLQSQNLELINVLFVEHLFNLMLSIELLWL